jgi:hypothetical protein
VTSPHTDVKTTIQSQSKQKLSLWEIKSNRMKIFHLLLSFINVTSCLKAKTNGNKKVTVIKAEKHSSFTNTIW